MRRVSRGEEGSVAAEFAVTLPALLLVLALGIGALAAGGQSVRLQDAAADAARLIARADDEGRARAVADAAGAAAFSVSHEGDLVCVTVASPVRLGVVPTGGFEISARSCALDGGW